MVRVGCEPPMIDPALYSSGAGQKIKTTPSLCS